MCIRNTHKMLVEKHPQCAVLPRMDQSDVPRHWFVSRTSWWWRLGKAEGSTFHHQTATTVKKLDRPAAVQSFSRSVVRLFSRTSAQPYSHSVMHPYSGAAVRSYICTVVQPFGNTAVHSYSRTAFLRPYWPATLPRNGATSNTNNKKKNNSSREECVMQ